MKKLLTVLALLVSTSSFAGLSLLQYSRYKTLDEDGNKITKNESYQRYGLTTFEAWGQTRSVKVVYRHYKDPSVVVLELESIYGNYLEEYLLDFFFKSSADKFLKSVAGNLNSIDATIITGATRKSEKLRHPNSMYLANYSKAREVNVVEQNQEQIFSLDKLMSPNL